MIVDKELLISTFLSSEENVIKTATNLRVSIQTVMASLNKYGYKYIKPKHIYGDLKRTDFSIFQKSILIGSLMGDGHLEKRPHLKNAIFREEHSYNQAQWLKWKYNNLKPFTMSDTWERDRGEISEFPDGHGNTKEYNIQKVISMSTISHPYLTELHEQFYVNRKKVLPRQLIEDNFDIIALSIFWGDDGCFTEDCIRFCTDGFSKEEVYWLADFLNKFYKSRITVRKHTTNSVDKYRIVFTKIRDDIECFENVRNILPQSMWYKLPPVLNEHQAASLTEMMVCSEHYRRL
jgi:hypothetical protein